MAQARGWTFTLNNYDGLYDPEDFPGCKYLVYSEECGESGTPHLQGYVEFSTPKRLAAVRKMLPTAHWEVRRGTPAEAAAYCKKIDDDTHMAGPYEWGEIPHQGERSDLLAVKKDLDNNATPRDLWNAHFATMVKFHRGIDRYTALVHKSRDWRTDTYVLVGDTGTGKSYHCVQQPGAYWKPRGEWWDGYAGEDTVILDDFYGWLPYDTLLRVCDNTPLTVPIKGGFVPFLARRVFITSNKLPEQWYKFGDTVSNTISPFIRRVTAFWSFTGAPGNYVDHGTDYIGFSRKLNHL